MTEAIGYHQLSLSVSDLNTGTEWYRRVLGLDVAAEIEGKGFGRTRLRAPGSGVTLTLTRHDQQSWENLTLHDPGNIQIECSAESWTRASQSAEPAPDHGRVPSPHRDAGTTGPPTSVAPSFDL